MALGVMAMQWTGRRWMMRQGLMAQHDDSKLYGLTRENFEYRIVMAGNDVIYASSSNDFHCSIL